MLPIPTNIDSVFSRNSTVVASEFLERTSLIYNDQCIEYILIDVVIEITHVQRVSRRVIAFTIILE